MFVVLAGVSVADLTPDPRRDPEGARRPGEDVLAMAEAAAGTRVAALVVAETEALTWAGRCEPGDVLGIADGEVVLIAPDLPVGALWLAHRMLLGGGEIVTATELIQSARKSSVSSRFWSAISTEE